VSRLQPTSFRYPLLLAALLLFSISAVADATRIELIELKGRTAEELIPLLQPVVKPQGALSGSGYRLIVRATDAQHREIRRLLEQLDHAPQRLLITVHMGQLSQSEQQGAQLEIAREGEHGGIALGSADHHQERGMVIDQQDAQGSASVRLHSTRSVGQGEDRLQVQALEGEPAFIATGSVRPYPAYVEAWRGPRGATGGAVGMDYQQASTGFYAVARLRGDQVVVQASPQKQTFDKHTAGTIEGQSVHTTVAGPLGSWLRLGSTGGSSTEQNTGLSGSHSTSTLRSDPVWLKVEKLP
jgi:hypothetical protein